MLNAIKTAPQEDLTHCLECGRKFTQITDLELCNHCANHFDLEQLWQQHDNGLVDALDFNESAEFRSGFRVISALFRPGKLYSDEEWAEFQIDITHPFHPTAETFEVYECPECGGHFLVESEDLGAILLISCPYCRHEFAE